MTISSPASSTSYLGNDGTTVFPFSFPVKEAVDLQVVLTDRTASPPTVTILAPSLYSVAGIGEAEGGSVTYPLAGPPLPAGQVITLRRNVPCLQGVSLTRQGGFYPDVIEGALDALTMQTQQLAEGLGRSVQVPVGSGLDPADYLDTIQTAAAEASSAASAAATSAAAMASSASAAAASADQAATASTTAVGSASAASTSATSAAASASSAGTSATNAANSATSASGSATTATTQASNAASSASSSSTSATNAAASATIATTKASDAAASQTAAATSATSAAASATAADASATAAAGSASTAGVAATSAASSAASAAGSATAAATSAADAEASAASLGPSASPAFAGLTLSGLTAGSVPFVDAGGVISQQNAKLYYDAASGRLSVNTAATSTPTLYAPLTVSKVDASPAQANLVTSVLHMIGIGNAICNVDTAHGFGRFQARRVDGDIAAPSAVQSGEPLADLAGLGYGTTAYHLNAAARIIVYAAEEFSDTTGAGTIAFNTRPSGTVGGSSERMRVDQNGNVGIGTASPGTLLDVRGTASTYAIQPYADDMYSCGETSLRWSQVYAGTGTINTSDAREKTAVRPLTDAEIAAAKDLAREIGGFQYLASVAVKGEAARVHVGMTVQRAMDIMTAHGLEPTRYAFICHDTWERQEITHPAETIVNDGTDAETIVVKPAWTEVREAGDRYGFRLDQLLAFILRGLEARLTALGG